MLNNILFYEHAEPGVVGTLFYKRSENEITRMR